LKTNQYIVVHAGKRDDYQVALALLEANKLFCLVTDDYVLRYFLGKEKRVPLSKIKTSYSALFCLFLYTITRKPKFQILKDFYLSKKAAKICNKNQINLFAYSYYGLPAFQMLNTNLKKYLFQLHPHPQFVKDIFLEEIALLPIAKNSLEQEHELQMNIDQLSNYSKEAHLADVVFCASSFTKISLEKYANQKPVHVIPYGVHTTNSLSNVPKNTVFNVLFVGSFNQRKGLYYLLEAIYNLQQKNFEIQLTLIGRGIVDENLLNAFSIKNIEIIYNVAHEKLQEYYQKAHVFVLPSICEGFGQVILEAMSFGTPVIATTHTSAVDVIAHEVDGFIIPVRNSKIIENNIVNLYENKELQKQMSIKAYQKAQQFTWQKFQENLNQHV
jgi:glycosyltransferase involved in cell wall biosynthesis